jgi:hypothetical protein
VGVQAVKYMMAVLPDGLDDDERRFRRDFSEDLHPVFLTVDESVTLGRVERVPTANLPAFLPDGRNYRCLDTRLDRPALLVRDEPRVSARNKDNGL